MLDDNLLTREIPLKIVQDRYSGLARNVPSSIFVCTDTYAHKTLDLQVDKSCKLYSAKVWCDSQYPRKSNVIRAKDPCWEALHLNAYRDQAFAIPKHSKRPGKEQSTCPEDR